MNADPFWTLEELSAQVALALADYAGAASGRVRDVPDVRTIRYYTTLGLIDRPAQLRGRTALYSRRHLLQLVAIKRLQAQGLALVQIQEQLLGIAERELARLAQVAANMEKKETKSAAGAFWQTAPAPVSNTPPEPNASAAPLPLQGIKLSDAVTLLLTPARPLELHDLEALRAAAAPLLKLLERRKLLDTSSEREIP